MLFSHSGCGGGGGIGPPPVDFSTVHRIVMLGDSLTELGGQPGGYVWRVERALQRIYPHSPMEVLNAGKSGHRSAELLSRFESDVLSRQPQLLTISVGINDVMMGFSEEYPQGNGPKRVPVGAFYENVETMIQSAQRAGISVVLFTITPFEDEPDSPRNRALAEYNAALRTLAKDYRIHLADQNSAFTREWLKQRSAGNMGKTLTLDTVHLTPAGNTLMARTALKAFGIPARSIEAAEQQMEASVGP